jgi:hypothetical protein
MDVYNLFSLLADNCRVSVFVRHCHHMLHYSVDGQLLYDDFHIFPYIRDA